MDRVTQIRDVRKWRACFPNARCANVVGRVDLVDIGLVDADLASLSGVEEVHADLGGCAQITDAGLAHIRGAFRTLRMRGCTRITDAGLAHLACIHTLDISWCTGITDAGLAHLAGIHTLYMRICLGITDAGLDRKSVV